MSESWETRTVKLWQDNTEPEYSYWREAAREAHGNTYELSQRLKEELAEGDANPLIDTADMYSDLLNGALSSVDWYDIAERLIDEVDDGDEEAAS